MSPIERYVDNITSVTEINVGAVTLVTIQCDTSCYRRIKKDTKITVLQCQYNDILKQGYYLV